MICLNYCAISDVGHIWTRQLWIWSCKKSGSLHYIGKHVQCRKFLRCIFDIPPFVIYGTEYLLVSFVSKPCSFLSFPHTSFIEESTSYLAVASELFLFRRNILIFPSSDQIVMLNEYVPYSSRIISFFFHLCYFPVDYATLCCVCVSVSLRMILACPEIFRLAYR